MGNADTKLNFRKAVIQLTTKTAPVDAADEQFWEQFWSESVTSVQVRMVFLSDDRVIIKAITEWQ